MTSLQLTTTSYLEDNYILQHFFNITMTFILFLFFFQHYAAFQGSVRSTFLVDGV